MERLIAAHTLTARKKEYTFNRVFDSNESLIRFLVFEEGFPPGTVCTIKHQLNYIPDEVFTIPEIPEPRKIVPTRLAS